MRPAAEVHHRKRRTQGGTWSPANLLHLCRIDHSWITGNPTGARPGGWAIWRADDPGEVPVLRRGSWVVLGDDGAVTPVVGEYSGGPGDCEGVLDRPGEPGLRCGLGEWHEGDHECGLVTWPVSIEERASV